MVVVLCLSSRPQSPRLQPRKHGTNDFTEISHVGVLNVTALAKLLVVLVDQMLRNAGIAVRLVIFFNPMCK